MNAAAPDETAGAPGEPSRAFLDLARAPVPWVNNAPGAGPEYERDDSAQRVLFVRVIARRNFSGFPFWVSCSPAICKALAQQAHVQAKAENLTEDYRLASLSPEDIGILRERLLLPEHPISFPGNRDYKRVFFTRAAPADRQTHALLGEVEHWTRILTLGPITHPEPGTQGSHHPPRSSLDAWPDIVRRVVQDMDTDDTLFARSERWGFLNSQPACTGSGLQFEVGLHLPALSALNARTLLAQTTRALNATGYDLQALSPRDPGTAAVGFFRLVSRGGAGIAEEEFTASFATHVRTVLRVETEARASWSASGIHVMEDRMHRALRILQEARRLEHAEAHALISSARAGVYERIFPVSLLPLLETLRVQAQPFHVATLDGEGETLAGAPEAARRAGLARRLLSCI